MFEDSEYAARARAFRDAGHELVHVGLEQRATVQGKKHGTTVLIDRGIQKVWAKDGNLISSRRPDDLPDFIKACLKRLK